MYKAEWLYTVAVKCCTTVVQRRSGECEKCRDKYIHIYATVGQLFSSETAKGKKLLDRQKSNSSMINRSKQDEDTPELPVCMNSCVAYFPDKENQHAGEEEAQRRGEYL